MSGFRSVRATFSAWFIGAALVPVIAATAIAYQQSVKALNNRSASSLEAIRDLKVERLDAWLEERVGDITIMTGDWELRRMEVQPLSEAGRAHVQVDFALFHAAHKDYVGIHLIALDGTLVVSSVPRLAPANLANEEIFTVPKQTGEVFVGDIEGPDDPTMSFSAPVTCAAHDGEHIIGVVVAEVDPSRSLYPLLLNRTGMGATGETLIINKDAVVISELRWQPDAVLRQTISATPARLAASGDRGLILSEDYRGVRVIAAYSHVEGAGWGLVSKMDEAEVQAPVQRLVRDLMGLALVAIVILAAAGWRIAQRLAAPVLELADAAGRVRHGEFETRVTFTRNDELGQLADAFNDMAGALATEDELATKTASISKLLLRAETGDQLATRLLDRLLMETGAQMGAIYAFDTESQGFQLTASREPSGTDVTVFSDHLQRTSLDAAFSHGLAVYTDDIPAERTIGGVAVPANMATIPLIVGERPVGAILLASLAAFEKPDRTLLSRSQVGVAAMFDTLQGAVKTAEFAEALKRRNFVLLAQTKELRELAAELDTQRFQLLEADRLKSEFLANMSHELRTPLNSVLALTEILLDLGTGNDPGKEANYLKTIHRNGSSLARLINDVLDWSKIEAGKAVLTISDCDLSDVLRDVVDTAQPLADAKGLELVVTGLSSLPAHTDPDKVAQILLNLVSNAVKFTDQGTVSIALERAGEVAVVTVRDTGVGIPSGQIDSVFDHFRQVDGSSTRRFGGTGLGLAIAKRLAKMLRGHIAVQSELGVGSVFTFSLARKLTDVETSRSSPGTPPERGHDSSHVRARAPIPPRHDPPLVLIVEDNDDNRFTLQEILGARTLEILVARDGIEGLEIARTRRPDLVLLDIQLPGMGGDQVAAKLRSQPDMSEIRIVAMTAKAMTEDQEALIDAGCDAYLPKPLRPNVVLAELDKWIGEAS